MVTHNEYLDAIQDYCNHINGVKKHTDILERVKFINEYIKDRREHNDNSGRKGSHHS